MSVTLIECTVFFDVRANFAWSEEALLSPGSATPTAFFTEDFEFSLGFLPTIIVSA
jgi:hypothetical protein